MLPAKADSLYSCPQNKRRPLRCPLENIAYISPATVQWARERAGLSHEELSTRLRSVSPSQVKAWESGESRPTFSQAEKLAHKLRLPFAILFMSTPPKITVPIPDLRTIGDIRQHQLSLASLEMVNEALIRQEWYREYLEAHEAEPLSFVGGFDLRSDISFIADDIRGTLKLDDHLRRECASLAGISHCVCPAGRGGRHSCNAKRSR